MPDLYATLNIPRDADRATIRAAYRNRAKSAHPDQGGSREKFGLVKLAHDTLTDEGRRARYDQTGEIEDTPVDNRRAQLLEMLATGLELAMAKLYERAKPPIQQDMVKLTKESLRELRRDMDGKRTEFRKNAERSKELLGRWSASGENLMEIITKHRVLTCETNIAALTERIALIDRALETLDGAGFLFDVPPPAEKREGLDFVTLPMSMFGNRGSWA